MKILTAVNLIIGILFTVCYAYQFVYIPVSWFKKKKPALKKPVLHDFAVLISARNEEEVIEDLIGSLKNQTYPREHLHIFVIADNCTDRTADAARRAGACVYERFNKELVGKGYALDALLKHLKEDHPEGFDGYFVFDADNILNPDYVERMNETFSEGHDIVTGYRNSKNYGSNWISAGYALWFLRDSRYLNHARSLLNTSCVVSGTGFLFSRAVAEEMGGWPYHTLTEDTEFTIDQVVEGKKIGCCREAELYDEQPVSFIQSWHQRMRWSRGYIQVLKIYGKQLFAGMFKSFSCFDMTMNFMPAFVLSVLSIIINITVGICGAVAGEDVMIAVRFVGEFFFNMYRLFFFLGLITTVTEWKHIHTAAPRKILYLFTFPVFMFTYIPISVAALFVKTSWKPIRHTYSMKKLASQGITALPMADGSIRKAS
ncbi:MAG: glycosyltransferase family 2 protein [Lachnospiraceae bacterium]|nr:glycosyltransferase family 2 protein [Lachnospiraceae bacterium]